MTKRALLIGINYVGSKHELRGCHNDIHNVKDVLNKLGYDNDNIVVLLDDNTHILPNRANILKCMRELIAKAQSSDTLYLHYSGHGSWIYDRNNDEVDGKDEVICPCDNSYITDDELNNILVKGLSNDVKLRIVCDCCHSGSNIDLACRYRSGYKFYHENYTSSKDIVMISGCKDDQTSADAWIDRQFTGALTWAFTKTLNEIGADRLDEWTWKELLYKIRFKLRKGRYEQIPQLSFSTRLLLKNKICL